MSAKIIRLSPRRSKDLHQQTADAKTIDRLRTIARESGDHLILADGPVTPDAALLDLCAEALHLLTGAKKARDAQQAVPWPAGFNNGGRECNAARAVRDRLYEEYDRLIKQAKPILSRVRKLRAATPAGIYAKALVVRASRTGAPFLAMSLAEDLIACRELREILWPAGVEPAV